MSETMTERPKIEQFLSALNDHLTENEVLPQAEHKDDPTVSSEDFQLENQQKDHSDNQLSLREPDQELRPLETTVPQTCGRTEESDKQRSPVQHCSYSAKHLLYIGVFVLFLSILLNYGKRNSEDTVCYSHSYLTSKIDLDSPQETKNKMLLNCCTAGAIDEVSYLLRVGADLFARDSLGRTPLQLAKVHGHSELAEFLLVLGADPQYEDGSIKMSPMVKQVFDMIFQILKDGLSSIASNFLNLIYQFLKHYLLSAVINSFFPFWSPNPIWDFLYPSSPTEMTLLN